MDHTLQLILRERIIKNIGDILGDLPLTNEYEKVLDEGITKGHTNDFRNNRIQTVTSWSTRWYARGMTRRGCYRRKTGKKYNIYFYKVSCARFINFECYLYD